MIKNYSELDEVHVDALCELGNIGAGNAATSLSVMLNEGVRIDVPKVKVLDYDAVLHTIGDPEDMCVAIMIQYGGDVRGVVLFILNYEDAKKIGEIIVGRFHDNKDDLEELLSDLRVSLIKEVGNILGCSYLGSVSDMTGLKLKISVPYVAIDMVGAILNAPLLLFSIDSNKILMIEESFVTETCHLKSHVIFFADISSLNTIMEKLGID